MITPDDCPRHQCGSCGRFVKRDTVRHFIGYIEADEWPSGDCAQCGRVDVACVPIERRSSA